MIPESSDSNSVDLYRCRQFPTNGFAKRPIARQVRRHHGLGAGGALVVGNYQRRAKRRSRCLLLFYSASLTGDWRFHPANPISTDIRRNRLRRPRLSQSQSPDQTQPKLAPTYGYSVDFNEITELSKERYSERPLKTITAEHWKGLSGIHTYNWAAMWNLSTADSSAAEARARLRRTK